MTVSASNPKLAAKKFGLVLKGGGFLNKFGTTAGTEIQLKYKDEIFRFRLWYEDFEYDLILQDETKRRNGFKIISHLFYVENPGIVKGMEYNSNQSELDLEIDHISATFQEINDPLLQTLRRQFGLADFRPKQREVIENATERKNVLYIAPTGAGKTITFFLPSILVPGITLVIVPLISLMTDMYHRALQYDIPCEMLSEGTPPTRVNILLNDITSKSVKTKLLFLTPESLVMRNDVKKGLQEAQRNKQLVRAVIDEAHCVLSWGYSFRPAYLEMCSQIKDLKIPITLTTATATPRIKEALVKHFDLQDCITIFSAINRANIHYECEVVNKKEQILEKSINFIKSDINKQQCGIVYCATPVECRDIGYALQINSISHTLYYAEGMDDITRKDNLSQWIGGQVNILVATKAAGTGLDKPNVRFIVHTHMPDCIEEYQQQTGRCGRDGLPSVAIMFSRDNDVNIHFKHISHNKDPNFKTEAVKRVLFMFAYTRSVTCRRNQILSYFGEEDVDCTKTCDNCEKDVQFEGISKTEEASTFVKCIQSVVAVVNKPSIDMCVKVFRKSCSKEIKVHNLHQIPEFGTGGKINNREATHLIYELIKQDVLILNCTELHHGVKTSAKMYISLGANAAKMMRREIDISIQK